MRAFDCPSCGVLVPFEAVSCLNCGTALGFNPAGGAVVALDGSWSECANAALAGCNWLLPSLGRAVADPVASGLCGSCRLTRTRPADGDLAVDGPLSGVFRSAEAAKRRLVFQLFDVGLSPEGPPAMAFDLLAAGGSAVVTGHADGVITVDLAESDDAHRERMRHELDEPYRTMLGHLRHETGHWCWAARVEPDPVALAAFRASFGDERVGYGEALRAHYDAGPPPGWVDRYVSGYAAAHPWEDWAETFAHYLHIRDTLQTAAAFGMVVTGPRPEPGSSPDPDLMATPTLEPEDRFEDVLADWLPLTYALNAVSRSMGNEDLYPFVLSPVVVEKLSFVHRLLRRRATPATSAGRLSGQAK